MNCNVLLISFTRTAGSRWLMMPKLRWIQGMMAGWGGQGATAFNNLMIAWNEKQETILKALDQLSASMVETERDNVATDEGQSAAAANLQGRLG